MNQRPGKMAFIRVIVIFLLTSIFFSWKTFADNSSGPVDHVDIIHGVNQTFLHFYFHRPITMLYHTPMKQGHHLLIGVRDFMFHQPSGNHKTIRQVISFDRNKAPQVDFIEYIQEAGFSPYLLINFTKEMQYYVKTSRTARIITVVTSPIASKR